MHIEQNGVMVTVKDINDPAAISALLVLGNCVCVRQDDGKTSPKSIGDARRPAGNECIKDFTDL